MNFDKEQIKEVRTIYNDKKCAFCGWLKSALNWWCTNEEAAKARGTTIPGISKCPWWKPDKKYIKERLKEMKTGE
jgi:hypothetical protein